MKKLFTLIALFALTLGTTAQTENVYLWKNGTFTTYSLSEIDSITFFAPNNTSDDEEFQEPQLTISGLDNPFGAEAGSEKNAQELTIECNTSCEISGVASWLNVSQINGKGNAIIKVWPNSINNSSKERTATFVVKAGNLSKVISVSQESLSTNPMLIAGTWLCSEEHYNSRLQTTTYTQYIMTLKSDGSATSSEYENAIGGNWRKNEELKFYINIDISATNTTNSGKCYEGNIQVVDGQIQLVGYTYRWNYGANGTYNSDSNKIVMTRQQL